METIPTAQETRGRLSQTQADSYSEFEEDVKNILEVIGGQIEEATALPATVGLKGVKMAITSKGQLLALNKRIAMCLRDKGYRAKFVNGFQVIEIDYLQK